MHLKPTIGSSYYYDIANKTDISLEAEGKTVKTVNHSTVGVDYKIGQDSSGNFVYTIRYDKIRIHTEKGDEVTDADAANASQAFTPLEKMLGTLKEATITATVDSSGTIIAVSGYEELGAKLIETIYSADPTVKRSAYLQFEKVVGDGIVKQNMEQFFMFFPDSAIHVGDTWNISSRQKGELPMNVNTRYTLESINDNIAIITAQAKLKSDGGASSIVGYSNAVAELEGTQEGQLQVDMQSGMLISSETDSEIGGSIQLMGREIPLTVRNSIRLKGKKK
jgi:hypothetical protein